MTSPSPAHPHRLYKKEKLCGEIAIARLFCHTDPDCRSAIAYPLLARWRVNTGRKVTCPRFLISVPKKRLRHAVDRVQMRRRIREAYRLNRHLIPADLPVDIAFTFIGKGVITYTPILKAMTRLLSRIPEPQNNENV